MENTSEIVAGLQELQNQVKYFHWQTKSYAQHQALGGVFDSITDLIDTFVETLMGKYGRPSTKGQKIEMFDFEDIDIEEWTGGVCDLLISFSDVLDDVQDTDLLNVRDEMLGEFNQLKYLLTLKENMKNKKVIKLTENDLYRIIKRVMNENEDTSMDEYINWDIKAVDCEGSSLGNMSSMGVDVDEDGNPKAFIRYCKGDYEELEYLKRKARHEIEQSNQLPSDDESLFENRNMKNKKVIKLTENDLYRIIKRVINEGPEIMGAYYTGSLLSTDGKYVKSIINNLKKDDNLKSENFEIVHVNGEVIRKSNNQRATKKMFISINENFSFKLNSYITVALYKKRTNPKNPTDFPSVQLDFGADENGKLYVQGVGL
jgi:uncharacterized protein YjhX (UPF0386 family)